MVAEAGNQSPPEAAEGRQRTPTPRKFLRADAAFWTPAPLLERRAAEGRDLTG
jgi:hypothetical protein